MKIKKKNSTQMTYSSKMLLALPCVALAIQSEILLHYKQSPTQMPPHILARFNWIKTIILLNWRWKNKYTRILSNKFTYNYGLKCEVFHTQTITKKETKCINKSEKKKNIQFSSHTNDHTNKNQVVLNRVFENYLFQTKL